MLTARRGVCAGDGSTISGPCGCCWATTARSKQGTRGRQLLPRMKRHAHRHTCVEEIRGENNVFNNANGSPPTMELPEVTTLSIMPSCSPRAAPRPQHTYVTALGTGYLALNARCQATVHCVTIEQQKAAQYATLIVKQCIAGFMSRSASASRVDHPWVTMHHAAVAIRTAPRHSDAAHLYSPAKPRVTIKPRRRPFLYTVMLPPRSRSISSPIRSPTLASSMPDHAIS